MTLSSRICAALCILLSIFFAGCKSKEHVAPIPGETLPRPHKEISESTDAAPKTGDSRRLVFAQIVEDTEPRQYSESGILEGAPYKYFLRSLVNVSHDAIRKQTNDQLTFDKLMDSPGSYRGQVVTLARGVFLEVSQATPPPEYGLPEGYTILPAIFVDAARDVYAVRILCAPGSKLFEKLDKSIADDSLPVARLSGYFMKLYARQTSDKNEPPWRRPILICPEPEFSQGAPSRHVRQELEESHFDRFLPSKRLDVVGAEERLVVELTVTAANKAGAIKIDGKPLEGEVKDAIAQAVKTFKARLPEDQRGHPAAVVLITAGAPRKSLNEILSALKAAGVQRLAVKTEL